MDWKKAIPLMTLVLAVIAGLAVGVQSALESIINLEAIPEFWRGTVLFVKNIFTATPFAVGLIWLRNLSGFIYAKARDQTKNVEYQYMFRKLVKTVSYYMGSIAVIFNAAPTPELQAIGALAVFFIDLIGSIGREIFSTN